MVSIPLHQTTNSGSPNFSRWASLEFLLDLSEIHELFQRLKPFHILSPYAGENQDPFCQTEQEFLSAYEQYLSALKGKEKIDLSLYRKMFTTFFSRNIEDIYRVPLASGKEMLKIERPFIQIKPIVLNVSSIDQSIHVSALNPTGILWGLQASFPQLFQKPNSADIDKVNPKEDVNAELFKTLRGYIREKTKPVKFEVQDREIQTNFRVGEKCLEWIHQHSGLSKHMKITV